MDEEFPYYPGGRPPEPKRRKDARKWKRFRLKPGGLFLKKQGKKTQAFRLIIKSGDRALFTHSLRITKVLIFDTLHQNREIVRSDTAYLEYQPGRDVNEFHIAGAGTILHEGFRLYFRCPYNAYRVKIWLRRIPIYVWPWLTID
jgi:hypothetical protein